MNGTKFGGLTHYGRCTGKGDSNKRDNNGNLEGVCESVGKAEQAGLNAGKILKEGFIPAMNEVGRLFEDGEYLSQRCWWLRARCREVWKYSSHCW